MFAPEQPSSSVTHVNRRCDGTYSARIPWPFYTFDMLLQAVLLPSEVDILLRHEQHKPNFVLTVLTQIVQGLPATEGQKMLLDATLTRFHQAVGSCERMIKTPIPRSYTR